MATRRNNGNQVTYLWLVTLSVVIVALVLAFGAVYLRSSVDKGVASSSSEENSLPVIAEPSGSSSDQESSSSGESSSSCPEVSSSETPAVSSSQPVVPTPPPAVPNPPVAPAKPAVAQKLEVSAGGVYESESSHGQVVITAGGVTLKNKTVTGDLFVMDAVSGDVLLENVSVGGTLYIYGGDNVTLNGVTAENTRIERDNATAKVIASGKTSLTNTVIKCNATISEKGLDEFSSGFREVKFSSSGKYIQSLTVSSADLLTLGVDTKAKVTVSKNSDIGTFVANAPTEIFGAGTIDLLQVKNDNVSFEYRPKDMDVYGSYRNPKQISPEYEPDEDTGNPVLATSFTQLEKVKNLKLVVEDHMVYASFDNVALNDGYCIEVYVDDRLDNTLYTNIDDNHVLIFRNSYFYEGDRLHVRVQTLGNHSDATKDSAFATSPVMRP